MRDPARQPRHGFHPVDAAEPVLHLALLGDVARAAQHADDAAVIVAQRAARQQQRAAAPLDHQVLLGGLALAARAHALVRVARARGLVAGEQRRIVAAHDLARRPTQQTSGARIDEHVAPLEVLRHDGVARALDDFLQQVAAAAQRLLGLPGLGDVLRQRYPGDDRSLLVPQWPGVDGKPAARLRELHGTHGPRQRPPEQRLEHRMKVGWQGLAERLALECVTREARGARALRQDEAELAVEQRQRAVGEVAGERPVERGDVARRSRPRGFSAGYAAPAHSYLPPVRDSAMGRDGIEPST